MTKDAPKIEGELLVVRGHTLIVEDSRTSRDWSIEIETLRSVKVLKRGRRLGASLGITVGGLLGGAFNAISPSSHLVRDMITGGLGGALVGWLIGYVAGGAISPDREFFLEGMTPDQLEKMVKYLEGQARISGRHT